MRNNKDFKQELISRAFQLARRTIKLSSRFPHVRAAWIIEDQLLRAVTSIGANIIEAQAASSKLDFIRFLTYALKSANEAKFWFELSKDLDAKLIKEINNLLQETTELSKILGSAILTLKGKKL